VDSINSQSFVRMEINKFVHIFNQIRTFQKIIIQYHKELKIRLQAFKEIFDENHNKSL